MKHAVAVALLSVALTTMNPAFGHGGEDHGAPPPPVAQAVELRTAAATEEFEVVTLLEGNTPLVPMPRLGRELGCELFVKFEGLNPTGSFKDRGMTAAISESLAWPTKPPLELTFSM